jgi:hypothetical protein
MAERDDLIEALLGIITDYREGEITRPDHEHVNKWIAQFPKEKEVPILKEIVHILGSTYISKQNVETILENLSVHKDFVGDDPAAHWTTASLLDIQKGGNSQHDFTKLMSKVIKQKHGITTQVNSKTAQCYYYIDDMLCSGSRVQQDLTAWIINEAPNNIKLVICIIALHEYGFYVTDQKITEAIKLSKKNIRLQWGWGIRPEDRKKYTDNSDVLRPISAPQDLRVLSYIAGMKFQPTYRVPGNIGKLKFFSSEEGRNLLEQELLIQGARIRNCCPNLKIQHRPLGFSMLETLGFGSMVVTYRNCPNNAPLALWVGDPWYPLLPRSTNADAAVRRIFESF